jgi:sulfite reductase beta subunit-like hemoprotein
MDLYSSEELNRIDDPVAMNEDIDEMRQAIDQYRQDQLPEDEFRKFRLHRGIYGQRADQQGFNMVRVKVPYGLLTAKQLYEVGLVAATYADGIAHVSTRQNFQFHWVKLENVPNVMARLAAVGLTTREACGNTVRNIVGSPFAGVAGDELFDITPYARMLAQHLLRNALNQKLPRKFKISFSGSKNESDGIIPWIHDIGFVAAIKEENGIELRGFQLFIGGGLGTQPRVADLLEDFTPAEAIIPTTEAIIKIFDQLGNRNNRYKARLKYVLWKIGLDEFRRLVNEERERIIASGRTFQLPEETPETGYLPLEQHDSLNSQPTDNEYAYWAATNVKAQKQSGYNIVFINPTIGDLNADQIFALADLANKYSNGRVRATTEQSIVLRWIRSSDLPELYKELKRAQLQTAGANTIASVTSCPGADTCNLGISHSRSLGSQLTTFFQQNPQLSAMLRGLRIKISGCPNSCGQHHVAAIGFHGASKKIAGREVPHYLMFLGGGFNSGEQLFGFPIATIPARRVRDAVSRLVQLYLGEALPGENFWNYTQRIGARTMKTRLKDLAEVSVEDLAEGLYLDIDQSFEFKTSVGAGECAG